jgi:hypothetical protein
MARSEEHVGKLPALLRRTSTASWRTGSWQIATRTTRVHRAAARAERARRRATPTAISTTRRRATESRARARAPRRRAASRTDRAGAPARRALGRPDPRGVRDRPARVDRARPTRAACRETPAAALAVGWADRQVQARRVAQDRQDHRAGHQARDPRAAIAELTPAKMKGAPQRVPFVVHGGDSMRGPLSFPACRVSFLSFSRCPGWPHPSSHCCVRGARDR